MYNTKQGSYEEVLVAFRISEQSSFIRSSYKTYSSVTPSTGDRENEFQPAVRSRRVGTANIRGGAAESKSGELGRGRRIFPDRYSPLARLTRPLRPDTLGE